MTLKDKLKKISDKKETNIIDWEKNKEEWIKSVDKLFTIIQDHWFSELEDEGLLKIFISTVSISEEFLGTYSISKMEILFATGSVILEPLGRNIIGGHGRIDCYLKGEISNGIMLILNRENNEDKWFVVNKQNRTNRELLTQSKFEEVIDKWIVD